MLEDLVEYFNRYAFTQVAIYGKSFLQAAKDTWRLVKSHGIDALINDDLISNVLGITALIIGVLSGVSAYAYAHYNGVMTSMSVVSAVAGFFVGVTFQMILSEIIISGVATTFVCFLFWIFPLMSILISPLGVFGRRPPSAAAHKTCPVPSHCSDWRFGEPRLIDLDLEKNCLILVIPIENTSVPYIENMCLQ